MYRGFIDFVSRNSYKKPGVCGEVCGGTGFRSRISDSKVCALSFTAATLPGSSVNKTKQHKNLHSLEIYIHAIRRQISFRVVCSGLSKEESNGLFIQVTGMN